MNPTSFIARRYLFSRKHISLISTLTLISIVGITIGTALLIVVLSVFNGFFDVIKNILLSYDPDIRIEYRHGTSFSFDDRQYEQLKGIPEIQNISPFAKGKGLVVRENGKKEIIEVKGVQKESRFQLARQHSDITKGVKELGIKDGMPGLLAGSMLLAQMGLDVGENVAILSAAGMRKSLTHFSVPRMYRFKIRGSFSLDKMMDESVVFTDLEAAQRLFNYRNKITGIDLSLQSPSQAEEVKKTIQSRIGSDFLVKSWYDLQKPLYDVMYLEKWGAFFILMLIVLVAVLNIVGSLTMIVIQKNRDIGVLRTMGFGPRAIKRIFLKQGLYVGTIGCLIGGGLGLLLSWLQKTYELIGLSSSFIIDAYPVSIRPTDIIIILAGSLLLSLAASWYPAFRASRIEPADAVRYE